MVFTVKNTKNKKVKVFDVAGTLIGGVTKYNTKTREATLFLIGTTTDKSRMVVSTLGKLTGNGFQRKPVSVKVKLPGSFIMVNNKKY